MRTVLSYFSQALILLGLFAIITDFFDRVPALLFWIYDWGNAIAWIIKAGMVFLGIVILFFLPAKATH